MYTANLSLSPEDQEIEYRCYVLDEQYIALTACRDLLLKTPLLWATDEWLGFLDVKRAIMDALYGLEKEIGKPDRDTLYTTDEVSYSFAHEDLAEAQQKLASWGRRVQKSSDLAYDNYGSPAANRQLERDIEARDEWQDRVSALQAFIAGNPIGDIPF